MSGTYLVNMQGLTELNQAMFTRYENRYY